MKQTKEYTIWDAKTPVVLVSSTNATPIVVTATAHGFATGDLVMIYGHATNTSANGIYKITKIDADKFSLQDRYAGTNIAGVGVGGATGRVIAAPTVVPMQDYQHAVLSFITSGTATLTVLVVGSIGKLTSDETQWTNEPNFGATIAKANPYSGIQVVDLDAGGAINGVTGIAVAGTDFNKLYEINVNALKFLTLIPSAWTQGAITAKILLTDNN